MYLMIEVIDKELELKRSIRLDKRIALIPITKELGECYMDTCINFFLDELWQRSLYKDSTLRNVAKLDSPIMKARIVESYPKIEWFNENDVEIAHIQEYKGLYYYLDIRHNLIATCDVPIHRTNLDSFSARNVSSGIPNLAQLYQFGVAAGLFEYRDDFLVGDELKIKKIGTFNYEISYVDKSKTTFDTAQPLMKVSCRCTEPLSDILTKLTKINFNHSKFVRKNKHD